MNADADQDGLDDGNEALAGTNPSVADSDQDGVDDADGVVDDGSSDSSSGNDGSGSDSSPDATSK